MPLAENFEIDVENGSVQGVLSKPEGEYGPASSVLLCRGVQIVAGDANGLFDDLTESLCAAGIAVVRFDHRCAEMILDDFDAHCVRHDLEDASAVFQWMLKRPDLNPSRIGALGFSLGAVAATSLARRTERLAKLCLVNATTASYLTEHMVGHNGVQGVINPSHLPASYLPSLNDVDSIRDAAFYDRPTLIIHSAADRFVDPTVSFDYVASLEAAGRRPEHVLIARADHTFSQAGPRTACLDCIHRFVAGVEQRSSAAIAASGA